MAHAGPKVSFIGPELKGRDKWLGGELGADGVIYGACALCFPRSQPPV
jgi:hypothetical protein